MAIIAKNISILENEDIIAKGINLEKIIANDIVVWEKISITNAPPFDNWFFLSVDVGTRQISETEISGTWHTASIYDYVINSDGTIGIYFNLFEGGTADLLCCSPVFNPSKYTRFSVNGSGFYNEMDVYNVVRYSNDENSWTNWIITNYTGNTFNHSYKYAQCGVYVIASSDEDDMGFGYNLNGISFS